VWQQWRAEFPTAVSYSRFIEFMPTACLPLLAYLRTCLGPCTGLSFLDATALEVCDNHRIAQHKVFSGLARRGKTSTGWFLGFKLHLLVNDRGDLLNFALSPGNTDDRRPVPSLVKHLFGKIFADKGYISHPPLPAPLGHVRAPVDHQTQVHSEEPFDAARGQTPLAQAGHYRNDHRPTQQHLTD
jgi:hypothetical protein